MIRVVLVNPPSPERLGAPLLGQQYVAAALIAHGCDVRVIDAAARCFEGDVESVARAVSDLEPDLVGVGLFTRWVWHAYQLVDRLRETNAGALLVAGGAHATVRPRETLTRGFDVAVVGEAEETIVELAEHVAGRRGLEDIAGILYRDPLGGLQTTAPRPVLDDLDLLAPPYLAQPLYEPSWYAQRAGTFTSGAVTPGGLLTSRGCPARCTFCANYVTGRSFRHRSARLVLAELEESHARTGTTFFPFWDDALTANRRRLVQLCTSLERDLSFPLGWSAITRANMVTPTLLEAMHRAGCASVNFGVESGDDGILRSIGKGITTDTVVRALEWAKDLGLHTACNFMLGFPQEAPEHVERTLRFMERVAPLVDTFSTLGVVVPFPGTPIYEEHHDRYGFTDWWLDDRYAHYAQAPPIDDREAYHRYYIDDANLELDFFRYDDDMRAAIRAALRFKAEHNLRRLGRMPLGDARQCA